MFFSRCFLPFRSSPVLPYAIPSSQSFTQHLPADDTLSPSASSPPPSASPTSYYDFWEAKISPVSLLCFYGMCVASILSLVVRIFASSSDETPSAGIFLRLLYLLPVFFHIYNLVQNNFPYLPRIPIPMVYLCDINIIFLTGLLGLSLIHSSVVPECKDANCVLANQNSLQPNILMGLYTSAFIGPVALKVHHHLAVIISFLICFLSSLISAYLVSASYNTYRMVIMCSIMQFLVLYDYERSLRKLYEDNMNLSATMLAKLEMENEKKLVQLKADEMRTLIGNVAHDLKSPLQSFLCELDTLLDYSTSAIQASIISSSQKAHAATLSRVPMERNHPSHDANKGESKMTHELTSSNTPVTVTAAAAAPSVSSTAPPVTNVTTPALPPAQSALLSLSEQEGDDSKREISVHLNIIESVLLLKSICSFMAMLINRAIDFTKVSSGFQLQPQYGTANLNEVMKWVIQCTSKSSNNGVAVELKPFPPEMCDHVITDTQWFSENVLCLVSNAQKFTTEGIIEISCRLLPKKDSEGVSTTSNLSSFFKNSLRHVDVLSHNSLHTGVGVVSPEDWMICVEVEDEGIGIPFEKREDLFQPFKQAQKRAGGTGLGLFSLSKRVESLGGRCGISDRLDKKRGCRFWFTVPYRPDEDAASLGIVPENPSHLFVSSEGSGTDSRVNEVITLLTERKKKTREVKEGKGKDGKEYGNDYDRGDGNRKSNKYKYAEGGRERGEEDHENDNNEENEENEIEILNEYIEHSISDNGLSSSTLSHRKNLPLLPNYIRINASVKPFNHESIPLGLENMEKQQQALVSPKSALMSSLPSLSMTNAPLTPAVASASARDLEPLRSFRDDSPELDPLEVAALSCISSPDQIATPPSLAAPSVVLPPPSLAAATAAPVAPVVSAAPVAPVVLKILLVEDSPLIQKTISRALIREGYEVDIAWNGSECLKMTRNTRYNVILMDLQMPIMDGLEACRRLRILESEAKAKAEEAEAEDGTGAAGEAGERLWRRHLIIGISANGDDLARDDALSSGMDDFIPKPVAMSALKDSLKRHWKLLLLSS